METQENLEKIEIGTIETQKLEPKQVKIVKAEVVEVGDKKAKKVSCQVKHPDSEDEIQISSVKYEKKGGKLEASGLWFNLDKEGKLQKGSALATFLTSLSCANVEALAGREVMTAEDEKGYLCFKAY